MKVNVRLFVQVITIQKDQAVSENVLHVPVVAKKNVQLVVLIVNQQRNVIGDAPILPVHWWLIFEIKAAVSFPLKN